MKLSILIAFVLVLAVTNAYPMNWEPRNTKSWFAGLKNVVAKFAQKLVYLKRSGIEYPDHRVQVKNKTDEYELRCYLNLTFARTHYVGKHITSKVRLELFMRLVHYFSGKNVDKVKIDMTVPVMTFVTKSHNNRTGMAILFFLPFEHQESPPKPTNPEVSIHKVTKGQGCVYVKSFSGYASAEGLEMKIKELQSALKKDGITDYHGPDTAYAYAVYNSPWTIPFLHHNEVWLEQRSPK